MVAGAVGNRRRAADGAAGWLVQGGEPFRLKGDPAIRVSLANVVPAQLAPLAQDLADAMRASAAINQAGVRFSSASSCSEVSRALGSPIGVSMMNSSTP